MGISKVSANSSVTRPCGRKIQRRAGNRGNVAKIKIKLNKATNRVVAAISNVDVIVLTGAKASAIAVSKNND